ncbi:hypothetical protein [Streptomyces sp. NPDC005953]|uniref:hypothetical protein n=1 Tax=Streptomyces sp. NPDC005953 TaxID=3156719 RepID=UPI0033F407B6
MEPPTTLLYVLVAKRGWLRHQDFIARFREAGDEAARALKNKNLHSVRVTPTTYRRWLLGTQEPIGDNAIVVERMFHLPIATLFQPASDRGFLAARPPHQRSLTAAHRLDLNFTHSYLFPTTAPPGTGGVWYLDGADFFDGTSVAVAQYEATRQGDGVVIGVEDLAHVRSFVRPLRRSLLIASLGAQGGDDLYLLDGAHARQRTALPHVDRVTVPGAYRVDPLTYALVWAGLNIDDSLQADDQALHGEVEELAAGLGGERAGIARSAVPDLSCVGAVWLGSHLCANYVDRFLPRSWPSAQLWVQPQSGEEAAAWLFIRDRHRFLSRLKDQGHGHRSESTAGQVAFCVPEVAVKGAEPFERVLLLLAMAVMEVHHFRVSLCTEPEYAALDEVVVLPRKRAIVANWLPRGDGICHAAVTDDPARVALYEGAIGHARARSAVAAPDAVSRLRLAADYLDLDWAWLTGRCRDLARTGTKALFRPRSRLVDLGAVEQSIAFLAKAR